MRINPFNPQVPARPDFFVGREPEITQFEKFLLQTISNSPMNMSITGNRGIGKTSLLVKLEALAKEKNCLVVRLSNYEGNVKNIIEFSDFISINIKTEILSKKPIEGEIKKMSDWAYSFRPQIEWNDVKFSLEKKQLVQEYFRKRLIKLWEEIKKDFKGCVILIDEAESLEKIEGIFQFLREVFQRMSMDANYMVVLAGKLNFPERMSESFSPLNRFFPVHKLEAFSYNDMKDYITKKLKGSKINIEERAIKLITEKSEGHPYVLVSMCFIMFETLQENEDVITEDIIKRALPKIYLELEKDFFSPMFHPLTPKAKEVLFKICNNINSLNFSFREAIKWTKLNGNYVSPYIQELLRKGIINKPEKGKYQIINKLFIEYVKKLSI